MLKFDYDLNENIIYISESIKFCEKKYTESCLANIEESNKNFASIKNDLNLAINICLSCTQVKSTNNKIKFDIFIYLISKHLNLETCVPSQQFSLDLILSLAIDYMLVDTSDILNACKQFDANKVLQFYEKTYEFLKSSLNKKQDVGKTNLFLLDLFVGNGFGLDLIESELFKYDFK